MDLGTIFGAIDLNDGPFRAGLTRSLTQLNGWKGAALKIAGVVGAGFATIAVGGFVKNSISAFADFESNLNQLQAATDAPGAAMKQLSDLALKMGKDTSFSAGEASAAMLELAKSGMTPAQIQGGALAATMNLAAAEGMSLESAATRTANAMNMFGLEAKDANEIANALAGGALASTASVDSLALGLSQVGPAAKNSGLSLQETVAVLAAFDNAGIKGSDAGTSLKTMLASLIPTSKTAASAMKEVGLMTADGTNAFINADGSFKSITQVAGLLQSKLKGLSEAQRTSALNAIFGADASKAAGALMDLGTKGIQKNIKATKDQTAAQEMAEARMKGLKGAIESLGGSVETLGISLLIHLGPLLTAAVKGLAGVFNFLIAAIDGVGAAFAPVAAFLGEHQGTLTAIAIVIGVALVPAFIAWAAFATIAGVATVISWTTSAGAAIASGATQLAWMTLIGLKFIWMGIQALLGAARVAAAWLIALGPIGLAIALIALVVFMVIKHWDTIKTKTAEAWGWVVTQVKKVPGLLVSFFLNFTLVGLIIKHWDKIKATFSAGATAVVGFMRSLPGRIVGALGNAGKWLLGIGQDIMRGLGAGIEKGYSWVRGKLAGVGRAIPGWLKSVLGISSPSRVMRDEVGQWIPAGVAEGIRAGTPGVASAARRMGLAAVIPITAAPSLQVPRLGADAASTAGRPQANGLDSRQGPLIEQHIHPQPGQSEEQIGEAAAERLMFRVAQ